MLSKKQKKMAGGEKSTQASCSKDRLKEDRISQLPDPLICHILSHLPLKDIVTTSVLSTRWTSLWLWVPRLKLDSWDFRISDDFKSFGDRFFDSNRASCIEKVKFTIQDTGLGFGVSDDFSYLTSWINAAVKRKIQHLHVCCNSAWLVVPYDIPLRLYTCETLVSLKLYQMNLDDVDFVSLPCLKTMHLKSIWYRKKAIFERLIGCCPVLEKLKIVVGCEYGEVNVFRVLSRSLKKLIVTIQNVNLDVGFRFVIDAPRLRCLSINDKFLLTSVIYRTDTSVKVDTSLPCGLEDINEASFSLRISNNIHSFLPGISNVRDMTICRDIFKLICQYSKNEPLPQFGYMSRLRITLLVSDLHWLPTFLESCPNLKSLNLVWNTKSREMHSEELSRLNFSSVPECLLSSLEFVDIKTSMLGHFAELKLVRYFLANSTILKKLTLRLNCNCTNEKYIVGRILRFRRRSFTCQVVIAQERQL